MNSKHIAGYQTLEVISKADKFNQWMYKTIRTYCRGKILEIGSGIGNISTFFVAENYSITLSDTDEDYIDLLQKKFVDQEILSIDLVDKDFTKKYKHLFETFDTVVFLNVLEHIDSDELAIENCKLFLKPKGCLVILVPAYPFLFSEMDKELKHFRRYTSKKLSELLLKGGLTVKNVFYFNAFGILAWIYGKVLRLKAIPSNNMKLFNKMVPFAKFVDKILFKKAGLSVIAAAQKEL